MKREEAVARIRSVEAAIRALGAGALYLFGSTARNEARADSDIDIFIDRDPAGKLGLMEFGEMERVLERTLGAEVDLCTRASLHPVLREEIERSAVRVL
jgi:predicted nucleotidyltransferase